MIVKGIKGKTNSQIKFEISQGARFVYFDYCISFLITRKHHTKIIYVTADKSVYYIGLLLNLLTLIFGWWSFPYGPIYTIQSLISNFKGGNNITRQIDSFLDDDNPTRLNNGYIPFVHPKHESNSQRSMRMTMNAFIP